ncbi:hypothetical protein [Nonlabens ulvanivorans]|uniref:hypothetical protein n=1 Tax=Nonlabens ulvanivorans TaxID=906888 RepID=UPI0037C851EB
MLRENDSKLSLLKKKLALKMKAEQNQNKIFLSEMMAVQKSFNSFIDRNELTFSELQLNQVVKICSNSLNIYTRIWSKL